MPIHRPFAEQDEPAGSSVQRERLQATLNETSGSGVVESPVESKVLRKRGTIRGTRLIVFDSLMEYLNGLDDGGRNEN